MELRAGADGIRDFCDAVGIARPVVYGHSLGGMVALVYAAWHPGHPGALVLQSTIAGSISAGSSRAFAGQAVTRPPDRRARLRRGSLLGE
jgi:pimeloyl-ACP methyl ester carboxylesterase